MKESISIFTLIPNRTECGLYPIFMPADIRIAIYEQKYAYKIAAINDGKLQPSTLASSKAEAYKDYNSGKLSTKDTTIRVTKDIRAFINFKGGFIVSIGTQGTQRSGFKTQSQGKRGTPDLLGTLHNGHSLGIEIKGTGRRDGQNDDQKKFMNEQRKANGLYWLVRTWGDFIALYDNYMQTISSPIIDNSPNYTLFP